MLCLISACSVLFCPQTAEGLPGHPGPPGRDHRGLLEDAVGAQLHHRGHAHQATGDGTGNARTQTEQKCMQRLKGQRTISGNDNNVYALGWFSSAPVPHCSNINSFQP